MRIPIAAIALTLVSSVAPAGSGADDGRAAPATPSRIQVAFKLDPRLSGSTYGGERWVSVPSFSAASAQSVLDARVSGVDARGAVAAIQADWTPADPGMVDVVPRHGAQVRITVKRPGEGVVMVTHAGMSRKLTVKAVQANGALQVTVAQ
jgi:hypothetical protein